MCTHTHTHIFIQIQRHKAQMKSNFLLADYPKTVGTYSDGFWPLIQLMNFRFIPVGCINNRWESQTCHASFFTFPKWLPKKYMKLYLFTFLRNALFIFINICNIFSRSLDTPWPEGRPWKTTTQSSFIPGGLSEVLNSAVLTLCQLLFLLNFSIQSCVC